MNRVKLESRLRALEHLMGIQSTRKVTIGQNGRQQPRFEMTGAAASYNTAADSIKIESVNGMLPTQPQPAVKRAVQAVLEVKEEKRAEKREEEGKSDKKDKKKRKSEGGDVSMSMDANGGDESTPGGESKEERRVRKEAKKAVSACF